MKRGTTQKRRWRFRGICADAATLGVHRTSLYKVLAGVRSSKSLMARYNSLKSSLPANAGRTSPPPLNSKAARQRTPPHISIAAAENLSPQFFEVLTKLGFDVVIVRFQAEFASPIWGFPKIVDELDAALQSARAGNYDSSHYDLGVAFHFFHATKLAEAMRILKANIEARGLLDIAMILHAETDGTLRVWHPPTADEIAV